jgi:hypothetical protein
VEATFASDLRAARLVQDDLALRGLAGRFDGDVRVTDATLVTLNGSLTAAGGWTGLGSVRRSDDPDTAALKRAFADFRLDAPSVAIETGDPGTTVQLGRPLRLAPRSGGAVELRARGGAPLFSQAEGGPGGAFILVAAGGGLPAMTLDADRYSLSGGKLRARSDLKLAGSFGLFRQARISALGDLELGGGGLRFDAARCADLAVERLELGGNDVDGLAGRLCPAGGPLLAVEGGGWRLRGRAEGVGAQAAFLQAAVSDAAGLVTGSGGRGGVALRLDLDRAALIDRAPEKRFETLAATGQAALAGGRWTGAFEARAHGQRLADLTLAHDGAAGTGRLGIDARGVQLSDPGLQPADVSPLAAALLGSPVVGAVDFTGEVLWSPAGTTSHGRFSTAGLDFSTPAGAVTGLKTEVELTSLTPLVSAPGQVMRFDQLASAAPVADGVATFQLTGQGLQVESGGFGALGGKVAFDPFAIPFDRGGVWKGVARLDDLELGPLVESTSFGERIDLEAKVDGFLPFEMGPGGFRIVEGRLAAVEPGRLSIDPQVLSGVSAEGGPEAPGAPGAPAGGAGALAYQALEHLAFDRLDAEVNSREGKVLDALFHIHGRHDPPQRQEIRLTWMDVLRRRFTDKPLNLPSDTEVNLTLDSSWNLEELLRGLKDLMRPGRRSEAVQAPNP